LCIAVFLKGIDEWTERTLFAWLPPWFYVDDFAVSATSYSPAALKVTAVALLLLNGLPGPIVEELYFRGFLLPRMERYGRWAPALNVLLFSLYHLYTPWQNLSRIVGLLPLAYFVRHKRNIYVGMIAHCALNLVGSVFLVVLAFAGS
jgi:hypothetical protein